MPNQFIGMGHIVFANILALICFWIYYKACATEPGKITNSNVEFY
jgi:hypothetical protein